MLLTGDYVTLMLINMTAGFVLLACYVCWGLGETDQRRWAPGFLLTGFVALAMGLHMTFTWPLPGKLGLYNVAFGETSVLLGVIFLAAAVATWKEWPLLTVTIYAMIAGLAAMLIGVRIIDQNLTARPIVSGIGFLLSGLAGVMALPTLYLRHNKRFRVLAVLVLIVTALIWAYTGYHAYWAHLAKPT